MYNLEVQIVSREKYKSIYRFMWLAWLYKNSNDIWKSLALNLLFSSLFVIGITYSSLTPQTFKMKIVILMLLLAIFIFIPIIQWMQKIIINDESMDIVIGKARMRTILFDDIVSIKRSRRFNSAFELTSKNDKKVYFYWNTIPKVLQRYVIEEFTDD